MSSVNSSYKLPIKTQTDSAGQNITQFKVLFEEYRAATKAFVSSIQFFFDSINNKYAGDLIVNEREAKIYDNFIELFNFNHFNVRSELERYVKREAEIIKAVDGIFSTNAPRTESVVLKSAQPPTTKADQDKVVRKLEERVAKYKKQRDHYKESNTRMHQQYLEILQKIDDANASRAQGGKVNRSFEMGQGDEKSRAHSVVLRDSNNSLNNTFEIYPAGRTPSQLAFNPDQVTDTHSVSMLLENNRSSSVLSRGLSIGSNKSDKNKEKVKQKKKDIERQQSEIEMLNKEVSVLKRELREERQEKALLIGNLERSVRLEKESSYHMMQNMKNRLEASKNSEVINSGGPNQNQSQGQISDANIDAVSKAELEEMRNSQIEVTSMLSSKIIQKNQTVTMLKNSLNTMLGEKRKLQGTLKDKSTEIENLQKKISELENKTQKQVKDYSELEATNSQITTKFLMSVEREGEIMKKYNQMKMKLTTYEKLVEKLKGQTEGKR